MMSGLDPIVRTILYDKTGCGLDVSLKADFDPHLVRTTAHHAVRLTAKTCFSGPKCRICVKSGPQVQQNQGYSVQVVLTFSTS